MKPQIRKRWVHFASCYLCCTTEALLLPLAFHQAKKHLAAGTGARSKADAGGGPGEVQGRGWEQKVSPAELAKGGTDNAVQWKS